MSDYRAIAGVSASLRNLLRNRMEAPVDVTIAPPDVAINGIAGRRLNLYLYEINENGSLKNQEIPGRGAGSGYGHPPLSLNLHYLVTAYGNVQKNFGGGTTIWVIAFMVATGMRSAAMSRPNRRPVLECKRLWIWSHSF